MTALLGYITKPLLWTTRAVSGDSADTLVLFAQNTVRPSHSTVTFEHVSSILK